MPCWLVVSSVPHYKSSSLYALSLYGTNCKMLLLISSSLPCQASCVDSITRLVHSGRAVPRLCWTLETFFGEFQNAAVDERCSSSHKNFDYPWVLETSWVMTGLVSLNELLQFNQVFSCKQFGDFFLDRWEFVPHPFARNPDSCQAFFVIYWLIMACLNKVVQVAARSFSCKQFGEVLSTDERGCASLH